MSELERIANGVRAFADDVNGPAAAARQLDRAIRQLADASARLEGPEASQARAAVESAASSARAVSGSLESFRANAHAFADRLALGGGGSEPGLAGRPTDGHVSADSGTTAPSEVSPEPELVGGHQYQPVSGRLFGDSLSVETPMQGELGDCYLIAGIAAVAATQPSILRDGFGQSDGETTFLGVKVGDNVPDRGATAIDGSDWVALVEKAYAIQNGGYPSIQGGVASDAIQWLTNRPGRISFTSDLSDSQLLSMCRGGHPWVSSSLSPQSAQTPALQDLLDRYGVFAGHAYTVTGLDGSGRVTLRNPWGFDHPAPLPIHVFRQIFWRHCTA